MFVNEFDLRDIDSTPMKYLPENFEKDVAGLDFAMSQGLHELETFYCAEKMKQLLQSGEKLQFSDLRENIIVLCKIAHSSGYEAIFNIHKIIPI